MEQRQLSKTDIQSQFSTLKDALNIAYMDARLVGENSSGFCAFLDFFQIYAGSTLKSEYAEYAKKHHLKDKKVELKGIYFQPVGQIGHQISDKEFYQKIRNEERDGIAILEETIYLYLTKILLHIENFSDTRQFYPFLDSYTTLQITICHGVIISYKKQIEHTLKIRGIEPERILTPKELKIPLHWEDELDLVSGL